MDFTKIRWAGRDCILITDTEPNPLMPIAILTRVEIDKLNKEWHRKD